MGELQFLWGLGLPEDEAECCDVYGLDEELLEMVPKPVLAVLFLYPITAKVSFVQTFITYSLGSHFFIQLYLFNFTVISYSYVLLLIYQSEEERLQQDNEKRVSGHIYLYNFFIYL